MPRRGGGGPEPRGWSAAMSDSLRILAVLALIGANAFFVIGEFAVVTARRASLATAAETGSRRAVAALRLMDDPVRVISTVQVGITALGNRHGRRRRAARRARAGRPVAGLGELRARVRARDLPERGARRARAEGPGARSRREPGAAGRP